MLSRFLHDLHEEEAQRPLRRERVYRDRSNPLDSCNDDLLYKRYRFDRSSIFELVDLLDEDLTHPTARSRAIPASLQVLAGLRYFASNSFQDVISETLTVDKATVSRIVRRFSFALTRRVTQFVKYPKGDQIATYKQQFFEKGGMPNIVGCIDCTHVKIIAPGEYAESYWNRKGDYSINVQAVCGPNYEFTNVVAKWPGSAHDARIFRESALCRKLEDGSYSGILLGDSGYGGGDPVTRPQKNFNTAQKRTRVLIEQTFGQWKRRFSILQTKLRTRLQTSFAIITSCAVLHNIAKANGLPDFPGDDTNDNGGNETYNALLRQDLEDGKAVRDYIAGEFFS